MAIVHDLSKSWQGGMGVQGQWLMGWLRLQAHCVGVCSKVELGLELGCNKIFGP